MPNWTPGPWRVKPFIDPPAWGIHSAGEFDERICEVQERILRSRTAQADANLIAAAPDLYDALEEQLQWTPGGPCQLPMLNPCKCSACKCARALAALAKAKGDR